MNLHRVCLSKEQKCLYMSILREDTTYGSQLFFLGRETYAVLFVILSEQSTSAHRRGDLSRKAEVLIYVGFGQTNKA